MLQLVSSEVKVWWKWTHFPGERTWWVYSSLWQEEGHSDTVLVGRVWMTRHNTRELNIVACKNTEYKQEVRKNSNRADLTPVVKRGTHTVTRNTSMLSKITLGRHYGGIVQLQCYKAQPVYWQVFAEAILWDLCVEKGWCQRREI